MTIGQTMLPEFDREMVNTRRMLECVPDGKFDPFRRSVVRWELAEEATGNHNRGGGGSPDNSQKVENPLVSTN